MQLIRPSVIDKQQAYWTWGDSVDNTEELVELVGDDAEQKTSTSASVEEKDEDIEETASLPSSSKASITYFPIFQYICHNTIGNELLFCSDIFWKYCNTCIITDCRVKWRPLSYAL